MNVESLVADRVRIIKPSAIREILKVVGKPGMVSLAGGIPAPDSFPMDIMEDLVQKVFMKYGSTALQYGTTEGFMPLRDALAVYLGKKGIKTTGEQICITSGSQGCLDAIGKVFINPGDKIAIEAPTYLAALQAFNPYGPEYVSIETDENGVIPESLNEVLTKNKIKFIYIIPTFQNPTGRTIPLERRKQITDIIRHHDVLTVEDDPYGELRFRGEVQPPIATMAPDQVMYLSTFSKIFAPGLRLGFYVAPGGVNNWLVRVKQGIDLHTSTFNQALAAEYLSGGYLEKQLPKIVSLYAPKQKAMLKGLDDFFPDSFTWSKPEGGMFIWAEGPEGFDAEEMYPKAIEKNVAYVPGKFFYANPEDGPGTMRLNFTMSTAEEVYEAVKTLGGVIKAEL